VTWQRERFRSQCPTHRISRFDWQRGYGTFVEVPKQLSDVDQGLDGVLPTPPEDTFAFHSISQMIREVAAAFLPHPALGSSNIFQRTPIARSATPQAYRAEAGRL
jgi:hypothetical protein